MLPNRVIIGITLTAIGGLMAIASYKNENLVIWAITVSFLAGDLLSKSIHKRLSNQPAQEKKFNIASGVVAGLLLLLPIIYFLTKKPKLKKNILISLPLLISASNVALIIYWNQLGS